MELAKVVGSDSVAAADSSEAVVAVCRSRVPTADVRVASAQAPPFADGEFDALLAQLVVNLVDDPPGAQFLQAVKSKNWALVGTLFHSAARRQGVALTAGMKGYQFEFVLLQGPEGSRLDIGMSDAQGFIIEIDRKTTGRSAISYGARKEMKKHLATAAQDLTKLGGPIGEQLSKSWVDFVRPHLPGVVWPK